MQKCKGRSRSCVAAAGLISAVLASIISPVAAQSESENECEGTECFSPVFDIGILVQNPVGQYGITELMYAVEMNDLSRVDSLLAAGADTNARNDGGATALLIAAAYGSNDMVNRLLAAGADPDISSHRGDSPLASAIQHSHPEVAVTLLEQGASPDVYHSPDNPRFRKHALVRAAGLGQTDVVSLMLERGVSLDEGGLEALSLALWKHHEETVALLLESDMDLNAPTYDTKRHTHMQTGELVLHTAAQQGLQRSTEMLLEKGADVNGRDVRGNSALYFAAKESRTEIVKSLLNAGAIVSADDIGVALDAGNKAVVQELARHLDMADLETAAIQSLIFKADKANESDFLERLFSERDLRNKPEPVTSLLFARADSEDCELVQWDMKSGQQKTVFVSAGPCEQGFFFNRQQAALYVVDGNEVSIISLDAPERGARQVKLPSALIEENLTRLKEQLSVSFAGHDVSWLTARVVQAGVLESGDFAIVTHSYGPADGTYGNLYALANNTWQFVRSEDCHRFSACRFDDVLSHSLHERPGDMTVWSPEMRRNPYFVDKTESRVVQYEDVSWNGIIALNIDGQHSRLHYSMSVGGHCDRDCEYTSGLSLELPDRSVVKMTEFGGNNAIIDRYALVWTPNRPRSELIDLKTGESVLGEFQIASWLH